MDTYLPVLVWTVGAIICFYLAQTRNVKLNFGWRLAGVFMGPFAIPFVFLAKSVQPAKSTPIISEQNA